MSQRTSEANRAILLAWQNEQELVNSGKGTRDWTQEQQQDILERGKAYDADGRAFEGQHMKSVEKYPEYQGDPQNIQFLTKKEHLEAHQGNWQNPTNWYYDPITKQFTNFGDGKYIPCEVIKLSFPVVAINGNEKKAAEQIVDSNRVVSEDTILNENAERGSPATVDKKTAIKKTKPVAAPTPSKGNNGLKAFVVGVGQTAKKIWTEHKGEIIGTAITIAVATVTTIVEAVSSSDGSSKSSSLGDQDSMVDGDRYYSPSSDDSYGTEESTSSVSHASPKEHEVPEHRQRYHTKNGVEWRDKSSYSRGGKKEE